MITLANELHDFAIYFEDHNLVCKYGDHDPQFFSLISCYCWRIVFPEDMCYFDLGTYKNFRTLVFPFIHQIRMFFIAMKLLFKLASEMLMDQCKRLIKVIEIFFKSQSVCFWFLFTQFLRTEMLNSQFARSLLFFTKLVWHEILIKF